MKFALENLRWEMNSRSLRSSQQGLLLVPFARTSTKQIRAFSVVGPSTRNGLPSELRIFNRTLSPVFFLTLRLLCLAVLVLGALLSSFLEEALYKCSISMNEATHSTGVRVQQFHMRCRAR